MPSPPSNYPRESRETGPSPLSLGSRVAGCAGVFVPVGLLSLAMSFGLMMAEGPQPDGSIGQEPGRGGKLLLALAIVGLCGILGAAWIGGRARWRASSVRLLLGIIVLGGTTLRIWEMDLSTLLLAITALALIVAGYVADGPPRSANGPRGR